MTEEYACRVCGTARVADWRAACAGCRSTQCAVCGGMGGTHRNAHRIQPVRVDAVTAEELETTILYAYALAHDAAARILGQQEALDCAHEAIAYVLAHRPFLPYVSAAYIVRASVTSALMRLRRADRLIPVEDLEGLEAQRWRVERGWRVSAS